MIGYILCGLAVLYFSVVVYAISRGRDVKASMKIPFALFSFESTAPAGRDRKLLKDR